MTIGKLTTKSVSYKQLVMTSAEFRKALGVPDAADYVKVRAPADTMAWSWWIGRRGNGHGQCKGVLFRRCCR